MKLKKVISLVLGGVMALSMLAGCSSSSGSETPIDNVSTSEVKTGIVSLVQSGMKADKVGEHQASVTLSGNEDTDLAMIREYFAGRNKFDKIAVEGYNFDTGKIDKDTTLSDILTTGKGEVTLIMYQTGALTEQDIADDLIDIMEARWTKHESTPNANHYSIGKISAFQFSNFTDNLSYGDDYVTINGTTYNLSEVTMVVVTMSSSTTIG